MLRYLLISFLLLQAPVRPTEDGTITGLVKTTDGKPAVGVRVTARPKLDSLDQLQDGIAMSSIAQTDQNGRFRLENVPPGRYYVAAGNIDLPTYYPGTLDVATGTTLQITPGAERTEVDFTLADLSLSRAGTMIPSGYTISLQIQVEGGGKLPIFSPNGVAVLEARRPGAVSGSTALLNAGFITVPFPSAAANYEVRVLNVPEGYAVKSMTYGSANLLTGPLQLSVARIPPANNQPTVRQNIYIVAAPSAISPTSLSITLTPTPIPTSAGVRVSGQAGPDARSIWLGEVPGFLYADGTFELRGVSPGHHFVLAPNAGASIVVGDRDIDGVQLDPLPLLPREFVPPTPSRHAPGTQVPLASLKGRVISSTTQQPVRGMVSIGGRVIYDAALQPGNGMVSIVGWNTQVGFPLNADGRFEIPKLLPGRYNLTASIFDYYTVNETVVIGEEDSTVEFRARPAF
jgi:hypothetical protein